MPETVEDKEELRSCSVMTAFDKLQLCYTISPQMTYYYRYGKIKDCSRLQSELTFCVSTKAMSRKDAHDAIVKRELENDLAKTTQRPSLDVWDLREKPLENFPPPI
ncbi:hypothetical protein BC833DRAFT_526834 [Globomyces pollinis-pini]|nr:hypothetical protein BC833DRAFT_526834 [Globomyces pollinis-pini]